MGLKQDLKSRGKHKKRKLKKSKEVHPNFTRKKPSFRKRDITRSLVE
jgi:hypothetical protein